MAHRNAQPGRTRRARVSLFACAVATFGLLLWARFIIVTGHPRTAVADPSTPPSAASTAQVAE